MTDIIYTINSASPSSPSWQFKRNLRFQTCNIMKLSSQAGIFNALLSLFRMIWKKISTSGLRYKYEDPSRHLYLYATYVYTFLELKKKITFFNSFSTCVAFLFIVFWLFLKELEVSFVRIFCREVMTTETILLFLVGIFCKWKMSADQWQACRQCAL